jgi:hypothetical protein
MRLPNVLSAFDIPTNIHSGILYLWEASINASAASASGLWCFMKNLRSIATRFSPSGTATILTGLAASPVFSFPCPA